jgi:aminoglycoside phosphotransferase (APT) family kinase protein
MSLTTQQLEIILNRAMPGARLREARTLADDRYVLALASGERLNVQTFGSATAAATAAEALRLLRGEIDLPIPQLQASDAEGATVGTPYVLLSESKGEPLGHVLPQLNEDQIYQLGRRMGEIICRVHRLICEQYGPLAGDKVVASDERGYVLARLARDIQRCGELGLLDRRAGDELAGWFERQFNPLGRQPALVHGALGMNQVLLRQSKSGWHISGLLGWAQALGWSPAWDHVTWLDATDDPRCFGLRVGYGNAYDNTTTRTYEQVREHALAPYRMLLMLQRMQEAYDAGDMDECTRRRGVLLRLIQVLDV